MRPATVVRHIGRRVSRRGRELRRLDNHPRRTLTHTDLLGPKLAAVDGPSFASAYRAIFEREIYAFRARNDSPFILDCGANVGLSVIYFRRRFPHCHIVAFEPDAQVFEALHFNVAQFGLLEGIDLVRAAVWTKSDPALPFLAEGADAGRVVAVPDDAARRPVETVPAVRLRDYLDRPVDLLKLDIEGAEVDVLEDCADRLGNVGLLFVEYHSFVDGPQRLDDLLCLLKAAGFRLQVQTEYCSRTPFVRIESRLQMDLQLNVFAFRNRAEMNDTSQHRAA